MDDDIDDPYVRAMLRRTLSTVVYRQRYTGVSCVTRQRRAQQKRVAKLAYRKKVAERQAPHLAARRLLGVFPLSQCVLVVCGNCINHNPTTKGTAADSCKASAFQFLIGSLFFFLPSRVLS